MNWTDLVQDRYKLQALVQTHFLDMGNDLTRRLRHIFRHVSIRRILYDFFPLRAVRTVRLPVTGPGLEGRPLVRRCCY